LVAGGAGGIGAAVVDLFMGVGAKVVSVDRALKNDEPLRWSCDISQPEEIRRLFDRIQGELGGLDVLIHCAGITRDRVVWKMSDEEWSDVMRVNLDSAFYLLRAAAPVFRERKGGTVVLVSSITAERGKFGQTNYAASKAGMIALGKTAALELGKFNVRVNAVAPAWVETRMTATVPESVRQHELEISPLGRLGEPEDVARVVLFLGSDLSRHVNGQVLRIDGGQVMT
jgi:3-oxoacyl-[acyl-carrier protein] reductase